MRNPDRHLDWEACFNVRDLGGLTSRDGRETKRGVFVRADIPSRLTADGRAELLRYGIRTLVDLREPGQIEAEPSIFMTPSPGEAAPAYFNCPLETRRPHVSAMIGRAEHRQQVYCILLDHYAPLFGRAVRTLARAQPGGVLLHCHAGMDRTGIVTALLLGLAGVPEDAIAEDYAMSGPRLRPLWEQLLRTGERDEEVDFWMNPATVTGDRMLATLEHLERRYGGIREYLLQAAVPGDDLDRVAQRLLG